MRYMKLTMGRRYFWTKYAKAESSPAFTCSMISASLRSSPDAPASVPKTAGLGTPAMASNPRSIATLLTSDSTLAEGESCAPVAADPGPEVPSVLWAAGTFGGLGSFGILGFCPWSLESRKTGHPGVGTSLSWRVDTLNWFVCYNIA